MAWLYVDNSQVKFFHKNNRIKEKSSLFLLNKQLKGI
jgi:hypothetical protein